jgi:hypothetical protein
MLRLLVMVSTVVYSHNFDYGGLLLILSFLIAIKSALEARK